MMPSMTLPTDSRDDWSTRAARSIQTLQTWPWLDTLKVLRQRFREDRLGLTASSLTFTTLISLVPLVTVMLAVFSAFPMFASFQDALQKYFLESLVPDNIAKPVMVALTQFSGKAHRLGTVGLVLLVLTALALMLTIDRTLNAIWRVRSPRPIAQRVLVYWAATTLGPLVLGVSLSLTSYALSASRGVVSAIPGGVSLLLDVLQFVLFAASMAGLFYYVPNTHVRWRHAIAGGVFVSAGFEAAKKLLGWYLAQVPSYTTVYGAFATVPILLIWIYLGWVIVLLGAVLAAYTPSLQLRVQRWPHAPGSRFHLAVALLRVLIQAQRQQHPGLSASQLAEAMRIDPLQTEPILGTLAEIDWIGRLDEAGDARYVLLCDPEHTLVQPLVARLLMEPVPALQGFWRRAGFGEITLQELVNA